MIRMVLLGIAFLAITVALLVIQPGSQPRLPDATLSEPVTRDSPAALGNDLAVRPAPPAALSKVSRPSPTPPLRAVPAELLDDSEMRRMTWETLANVNSATGRESAPGQPGSLLHTIVRRSLNDGPLPGGAVPSGASDAPDRIYVVQIGDSLVSIAESVYGDVNMTGPLFAANQATLTRPDDLRPGQRLILPDF